MKQRIEDLAKELLGTTSEVQDLALKIDDFLGDQHVPIVTCLAAMAFIFIAVAEEEPDIDVLALLNLAASSIKAQQTSKAKRSTTAH